MNLIYASVYSDVLSGFCIPLVAAMNTNKKNVSADLCFFAFTTDGLHYWYPIYDY